MKGQTNWQYWKAFAKFDKAKYLVAFVLMLLSLFFDLVRPFLLKNSLDFMAMGELTLLRHTALLFLLALVLEYACKSSFQYCLNIAFLNTLERIRNGLFRHVLRLKMAYFDHQPMGSLLTRTVHDTESLRELLNTGVATVILDILTILGIFCIMFTMDLALSPVMLVATPVVLFLVQWFSRKLQKHYLQIRTSMAQANGFLSESLQGREILSVFHQQKASAEKFGEINEEYLKASLWSNLYDTGLYSVVDGISFMASAVILYVGFGMRFGISQASTMILYLNLVERIFIPIRELSWKLASIQTGRVAWSRVFALLSTPESIPLGHSSIPQGRISIAFSKVSFRYENGPWVLKNITFDIQPGEMVALVGATGSGKSTIGKLLTRAYDGYEGEIHVGGVELKQADYFSLRSRIAVVHQDALLFPGTLRENITMFNKSIPDSKIHEAIDIVKAREFISALPQGLDFQIQENGRNLSGGQIQLIAFARSLVYDANVLLMDEATSSVDSVTETWIQNALQEIFRRKTSLVIAHRLSTIACAHKIFVLQEGEIVQAGNHLALLQDPAGAYAQFLQTLQK